MKTYLISYDLSYPDTTPHYSRLINLIKGVDYWAKPLESVWLIKSNLTSAQIRDRLLPVIYKNDKLLVIDLGQDWATYGLSQIIINWIKGNISP